MPDTKLNYKSLNVNLNGFNDKMYGVYFIINNINNKFYIGSTIQSFKARFSKHLSSFVNKQFDFPLYRAISKYGIENFTFKIVKAFNAVKDRNVKIKVIRYLEEKLIKEMNPEYNVCKEPTKGGSPNLGRKLSEEWKEKLRVSSSKYKHKDNIETYNQQVVNNQNIATEYCIFNNTLNVKYTGNKKELTIILKQNHNIPVDSIIQGILKYKAEGWEFIQNKKQKKIIQLFQNKELIIELQSFYDCDKFLNMWRGYTSTNIKSKMKTLKEYEYLVKI